MKTILITGASDGIGLEASAQLAAQGHRVVMVGRNPEKTAAAVAEVVKRTGSGQVSSMICDFASLESVRALADEVRADIDHLDVLVNNAGTVSDKRTETQDGFETTFGVNHLGPFLLTELLRDLVVSSAPARIVFTASDGHYRGTMNFDDLGYERGYHILKAYFRSKLANVLYARHLARELEGTGVTVNALHPGGVATNIWGGAPAYARPVLAIAKRLVMISPADGGKTITFLATSPEVEGKTGGYYEKNRLKRPAALALDDALGERLAEESAKLVGLPAV